MQAALDQAFMWARIRARRSDGVLSMKLTVNLRGEGPQYFEVKTAICRGSIISACASPNENIAGAFTGLICLAVAAAFMIRRWGNALILHAASSCSWS